MSGMSLTQPDITLTLDLDGVILDVTLSQALSSEKVQAWRGRPWDETVDDSGTPKVRRMVEDARRHGVSAYSHLNQTFPSGLELPMEFTTVRLGEQAGLIAIGRSLQAVAELQSRLIAAQQAMEQDYWKLREVETRYRILFDASHEAVLLVQVQDLRIVEANPAAIRALGVGRTAALLTELAPAERDAFQAMLLRVREQGRAPGMLVHLGPERRAWTVRGSLMNTQSGSTYLLQFASVGATSGPPASQGDETSALEDLIERLPDGFVMISDGGIIRRANQAFLGLTQIGAEGGVIGERLGRWLARPGADIGVLLHNLERYGVVRRFATAIQGELGSTAEVEISAAAVADGADRMVGLVIRDVGSRQFSASGALGLRTTLSAIIEQTGKTSLPKLIGDATALVERHCIEAALDISGGNRTEAAELLGLSRQSLYKKLSRYDIDRTGRAETEPPG